MELAVGITLTFTSSHNHGSQKWVPRIVVTFQTWQFSTSMIMGESLYARKQTTKLNMSQKHSAQNQPETQQISYRLNNHDPWRRASPKIFTAKCCTS